MVTTIETDMMRGNPMHTKHLRHNAQQLWHEVFRYRSVYTRAHYKVNALKPCFFHDWVRWAAFHGLQADISFVTLLTELVSANGTYLAPVFNILVRQLVPPNTPAAVTLKVQSQNASTAQWLGADGQIDFIAKQEQQRAELLQNVQERARMQERQEKEERQQQDLIHQALAHLIAAAPTGYQNLFSTTVRHYPHMRLKKHVHETYVRHLLRITTYAPMLRQQIVLVVLERLVELDVEIKLRPGILAVEVPKQALPRPATTNGGDIQVKEEDDEKEAAGGDQMKPVPAASDKMVQRRLALGEMADKLDSCMCQVQQSNHTSKLKTVNSYGLRHSVIPHYSTTVTLTTIPKADVTSMPKTLCEF